LKIARSLLFALLLAAHVTAQQPAPVTGISFERVTRASRESLRDSAELPMRVTTDFSATDLNGRVRKHRTGKFDYDFHGFNPRSDTGNMNMHGTRSAIKEAGTAAVIAMLPSVLVASDVERRLQMKAIDSPQPDVFAAEFVPDKSGLGATYPEQGSTEKPAPEEKAGPANKCQTSGWMREMYVFQNLCVGRVQVQLQKGDLSMKSFTYDADGLPLPAKVDYLGQANITGYHVDIAFQKVTLPGDPKPFVVPRHVVVTVTTDKGKLVMTGEFALKK